MDSNGLVRKLQHNLESTLEKSIEEVEAAVPSIIGRYLETQTQSQSQSENKLPEAEVYTIPIATAIPIAVVDPIT